MLQLRLGITPCLHDLLTRPTAEIYAMNNISFAAVIICSIQVGITDCLRATEKDPDWVMGCSLGDLARAVLAGAYDFEDAITNHVRFTQRTEGIDRIGRNIGVACSERNPFSEQDYAWFDRIEVDVSRLTPRFLNIGGRFAELELVERKARERGWHVMPILEYPAHSRHILPYVERVADEFRGVQASAPRIPIFSSFSCRPLENPEEIKKEFLLSITQAIHWHEAISALIHRHGVCRFVNIGPCRSLSKMMEDIPGAPPVIEASELLA